MIFLLSVRCVAQDSVPIFIVLNFINVNFTLFFPILTCLKIGDLFSKYMRKYINIINGKNVNKANVEIKISKALNIILLFFIIIFYTNS